jgi:hypothetical protein
MRRNAVLFAYAVAIAIASASLVGCQELFTTSLASSLARDSFVIPDTLTTDQAADLAAQAKANDDAKLAAALVASLLEQIEQTTDPAEKAKLEAIVAGAAVTASGASGAVTDIIAAATSEEGVTEAELTAFAEEVKAGASEEIVSALSYLDPETGLDPSESGLTATEYLIAAVVIASSVTVPEDGSSYSAEDTTKLESAERILEAAVELAGDDPTTAALIASLMGSYGL